jgi:hypothetical protein
VQALRRKDTIESVRISGDFAALFERKAEQLAQWNEVLDREFPELLPPPSL